MPDIKPFKAVRASEPIASHLISRTYQDYSEDELKNQLTYNPYTFLQILNPGYKFYKSLKANERYSLVRNRYLEFIEDHYMVREQQEAIYIYENQDLEHKYTGIIAGTSIEDYKSNNIKKHENTIQSREELFKEYLKFVGFNAEPVLLTYPDKKEIDNLINQIKETPPVYHFSTFDRSMHKLWVITDLMVIKELTSYFKEVSKFYIADGHHRSVSSHLISQELGKENDSYNWFMSFIIPESQLNIYEYNRLIKGLNGLTTEEFLIRVDEHFKIHNHGLSYIKPREKHEFTFYLDGAFYSLKLRRGSHTYENALDHLDPYILFKYILEPILGITDLRDNTRIEYTHGSKDIISMRDKIDREEYTIGFSLFPVTVDQIKAVADADLTMPPKSTYIRPKLPSGLTVYEF